MNNSNTKFMIVVKTQKAFLEINKLMDNIPRRDFFYKDKINNLLLNMLEGIYQANYDETNFLQHIVNIKSKLALLDYLIEILYKKRYISLKQMEKNMYLFTEITKMIQCWVKSK